jgi:hypothetical protein
VGVRRVVGSDMGIRHPTSINLTPALDITASPAIEGLSCCSWRGRGLAICL